VAGFASQDLKISVLTKNGKSSIIFDGKIGDIHKYLRNFRVFVSPLRYGAGVKKKILDAVVAGCPVVTTQVGSEGTGLQDGQAIMIASDPGEYAKKIIQVYTDSDLWKNLSSGARSYIMKNNRCGAGIPEIEQYLSTAR
jgi:glycosyltransferase involved in cell wall biosynthesis